MSTFTCYRFLTKSNYLKHRNSKKNYHRDLKFQINRLLILDSLSNILYHIIIIYNILLLHNF